jgi:hypothetical protein
MHTVSVIFPMAILPRIHEASLTTVVWQDIAKLSKWKAQWEIVSSWNEKVVKCLFALPMAPPIKILQENIMSLLSDSSIKI